MKFYNIQNTKVNLIGAATLAKSAGIVCVACNICRHTSFYHLSGNVTLILSAIRCKYNIKQCLCSTFHDYLACHFKFSVAYLYDLK